jgi:GNAT superfamily N-acetyltransferase
MIHIRAAQLADAPGIARVHVDAWRTTYPEVMPAEFLASLTYAQREQLWQQILTEYAASNIVFVALLQESAAPEQVIGFASGGPEQTGQLGCASELYAIYLLASYQRQGLGRQLTAAVVRELVRRGFPSMAVWVVAENPARRFYEALGGRYLATRTEEIGGATITEIAYGWAELPALLAGLNRERP